MLVEKKAEGIPLGMQTIAPVQAVFEERCCNDLVTIECDELVMGNVTKAPHRFVSNSSHFESF